MNGPILQAGIIYVSWYILYSLIRCYKTIKLSIKKINNKDYQKFIRYTHECLSVHTYTYTNTNVCMLNTFKFN